MTFQQIVALCGKPKSVDWFNAAAVSRNGEPRKIITVLIEDRIVEGKKRSVGVVGVHFKKGPVLMFLEFCKDVPLVVREVIIDWSLVPGVA